MRRRFVIFLAAILVATVMPAAGSPAFAYAKAGQGVVDAVSYTMTLRLDTKKDRLYETVRIKVRNETDQKVGTLYLRDMSVPALKYAKDNYRSEGNSGKRSKVLAVTHKGRKLSVTKEKKGSVLKVKLGGSSAIDPGKNRVITVKMYTDIPNRQDRFAVQKTRKGKIYKLSFCFPYLADNEDGKWNKDPFFDDGESRSYDLADYDVTFRAPVKYVVAATGSSNTKKGKKTGVTRIKAYNVRDFAIVASNMMKKDTFTAGGVTVNNYYLPGKYTKQYRSLSKMTAKDSIEIFNERIGQYPYGELDIVECLFGMGFGGMEYPELIMVNGSSYFDGMGPVLGAQGLAECVAHEIGHQWFYAAVGNCEYREGWIDEGFTSYVEHELYSLTDCPSTRKIRQIDPLIPPIDEMRNSGEETVAQFRSDYVKYPVNIAPNKYPPEREYGEGEYEGGYAFLCDVRRVMGQEKFDAFLKDYYENFKFKKATTGEIVRFIETYDGSDEMREVIGFWTR